MIRCRDLVVERGGRRLLDGVTLDLKAGEHWVLWGANGAGKTTLARALAGFLPPDSGELEWDASLTPPLPLLFQDPDAQIAAVTVRDEVALGARAPGEPYIARDDPGPAGRRLARALRDFRLEDLARRNPHSLSGGEKRRLNLAAVSVLESSVLILDEPELHLDPAAWEDWTARLEEWRAGGERCLLEISRVPERVLAAEGLAVLHEGRLLAAGPPPEVYRDLRGQDLPLPRIPAWEAAAASAVGGEPKAAVAASAVKVKPEEAAAASTVGGEPKAAESPAGAAAKTPLLGARDLVLARPGGGSAILDGVSLDLSSGDRVLILGSNGSGKTSLLLLLAGLADPDAGRIEWGRLPRAALSVGMAFQEPERSCFAETVAEELGFGLKRLNLEAREREERVKKTLASLGLDPDSFLERDPFRLSLGELRRVALASVIALKPAVLLLDEPCAALDPEGRTRLLEALEPVDAALLWADCREPEGYNGFFKRCFRLEEGKLLPVEMRRT